jgi:hypothetical protein
MEFVGNKKTACFCGSAKCSGLIGEKPKEIKDEKKQHKQKRKLKIKAVMYKSGSPVPSTSSSSKAGTPPPRSRPVKRRRMLQETVDPLNKMMDKMVETSDSQQTLSQEEVDTASISEDQFEIIKDTDAANNNTSVGNESKTL